MERQRFALFCSVLILLASNTASAQTLNVGRLEAVADSVANAYIATGEIPGMSMAVAKDGEIVFVRGYGLADVEMDVVAAPETVYRIGSVTKQFTAAIIMRLVEAGEISLDDPITKYLPDYPVQGHHVTVRHLLNHTSGIPNIRVRDVDEETRQRFKMDLPAEEVVRLFAELPFDFAPGEQHRYSNSGYLLLGMIIEKVTGTPFSEYVERELLQPLGLDNTLYCDTRRIIPNRAEGYEYEEGELINAPYLSMVIPAAAGALCSTAGDLVRWTHLLHSGQVVSPASLRQMTTPTVLASGDEAGYGYGLQLNRFHLRPVIFHGGSINGFIAALVHYPEDSLSIALLFNAGSAEAYERIELAVARAALGIEILDLPLTAGDMARYLGTYTIQWGERTIDLRVFGEGGQLNAEIVGQGTTRLLYQGDHRFITAADDEISILFNVENGRTESIAFHLGPQVLPGQRTP
jgi:D-alanyl-D-alanine carboxypeptidase